MTSQQAKEEARRVLSQKRFAHVANVAAAAARLARRYGADEEKTAVAAWLHDIAKELSPADLLQLLGQDAIIAKSVAGRPPAVWHAPAGAVYARQKLGVTDTEVLDAIAAHTTGRPGMTQLDKIIFLADLISAERSYPGVEDLRRLAGQNLDEAVAAGLVSNLRHVRRQNLPVDPETQRALEDIRAALAARQDKGGGAGRG